MQKIIADVLERNGLPGGIVTMVVGSGRTVGEQLIQDPRLSLVSFTGSSEVRWTKTARRVWDEECLTLYNTHLHLHLPQIGVRVAEVVHRRFGSTILELGGNNSTVGTPPQPPLP